MAKALNLFFRLSYVVLVLASIAGVFALEMWVVNTYRDAVLLRTVVSLYTFAVLFVLTITLFQSNGNWFTKLLYGVLAVGILLGVILMPTTALLSGGPAFLLFAPFTIAFGPGWWD